MTNNPAKVAMMQGCGLDGGRAGAAEGRADAVQRRGYLDTKAAKSGHLL